MLVDFLAGTHISDAAKQLAAAAQEHGEATGSFNGIALWAGAGTTAEEIVADFAKRQTAAAEAYRNSPEGKKAEADREDRRARAQAEHDRLMRRLASLDMSDDVAVLDWLCAMQAPSDHVGVIVRRSTIVSKFEAAGYAAGANCGKDYKPGDRANTFRYLVGQALDGLKNGPAIHPIIHKFAGEWKSQFRL
jgi:hypothetical protein